MQSRSDKMRERYGYALSDRTIRRVWAAVTATPHASCRQMGRQEHMSWRGVSAALTFLNDCGYIEQVPRRHRARRIVVPFVVIERRD